MQPYISPNTLRALGSPSIHVNMPGVVVFSSVAGGGDAPVGSAAPPEVFTQTSGNGSNASITLTAPSDIQEGDFMLAHLTWDNFGAIPMSVEEAGWNKIVQTEETIPNNLVYWRFATADDIPGVSQYTWTAGISASYGAVLMGISGVNATNPIGQVTASPHKKVTTQDITDPNAVEKVFSGAAAAKAVGVRAMFCEYDNSLVIAGIGYDTNRWQQTAGHQDTSGYQTIYKMHNGSLNSWAAASYIMSNAGLSPATTLWRFGADGGCGWALVLNPETLETTVPGFPYVPSYSTRYIHSTQPITVNAPSGLLADDLLVMIAFQGGNPGTNQTCVDDVGGSSGWIRGPHGTDYAWGGFTVFSKVAGGTESTITFDSNVTGYQQATVLAVRGTTSGVLLGPATEGSVSGYSEVLGNVQEILGPSIGLHQDGTLVIHAAASYGTANTESTDAWDIFGIPNPEEAGQNVSGIFSMSPVGAANSIGLAVGMSQNATGSGLLAPKWHSDSLTRLQAIAFSIY